MTYKTKNQLRRSRRVESRVLSNISQSKHSVSNSNTAIIIPVNFKNFTAISDNHDNRN